MISRTEKTANLLLAMVMIFGIVMLASQVIA